jgi:hypothetical protein
MAGRDNLLTSYEWGKREVRREKEYAMQVFGAYFAITEAWIAKT